MKTPWRTAFVGGEVGILDPRREHRAHPADVLRRPGEHQLRVLERRQPGVEVPRVSPRRTRSRPCRGSAARRPPTRRAPARRAPGCRRDGEAGDDEIAGQLRLGLGPGLRPARLVRRRGALRDDAFEPQLRDLLVERLPAAGDMVAELDGRPPGRPRQQLAQQLLAPLERHRAEVPAVEPHEVEGVEQELASRPARQRVLQQREPADPLRRAPRSRRRRSPPCRAAPGKRRRGRRSGASSRARRG